MPGPGSPPPKLVPFGEHEMSAGTVLRRFYQTVRAANVFNPCQGNKTRFAPLSQPTLPGGCVPTLYAGETYEAAAFETLFRDLPPLPNRLIYRKSGFSGKGYAQLRLQRPLKLAPFFNQNLRMLGQTRATMIETDATCYLETIQWALAVHRDFPDFDGLIWTSRQHDQDTACVFFDDRVSEADLLVGPEQSLDTGAGEVRLSTFAADYGIDLIP